MHGPKEKKTPRGGFFGPVVSFCAYFCKREDHTDLACLSFRCRCCGGCWGMGASNVLQSGSLLYLSSKRTKRQKYTLQRAPQSDSGGRRRVKSVWSSRVEWYNPAASTAPNSALFSLDRERPVSLFSGERKEKWGVQTSQPWEWRYKT